MVNAFTNQTTNVDLFIKKFNFIIIIILGTEDNRTKSYKSLRNFLENDMSKSAINRLLRIYRKLNVITISPTYDITLTDKGYNIYLILMRIFEYDAVEFDTFLGNKISDLEIEAEQKINIPLSKVEELEKPEQDILEQSETEETKEEINEDTFE